jgi:hypothetical protein
MAETSWMRRAPTRGELTDIGAVEHDIFVEPGRGDSSSSATVGRTTWIAAAKAAAVALAVLGLAVVAAFVLVALDAHA